MVSQPRYRKRIDALAALGCEPVALSFDQESFPGEPKGGYIALGRIRNGAYWRRLLPYLRAVAKVRRAAGESDVLYLFDGVDLLLLAWVALLGRRKRPAVVFEIGDIQEAFLRRGPASLMFRLIERFLVGRTALVVVTSPAYVEEYYKGRLGVRGQRFVVIENKVDPELGARPPRASGPQDGPIRIGYFGLLRCERSWSILKGASERAGGQIQVYVRGFPLVPENLAELAAELKHLKYEGTYVAPRDLAEIYGQVDIVWACYPHVIKSPSGNWRWARTNRFYEGCFFRKPVICRAGTQDARIVRDMGLGLCLDTDDIEASIAEILKVGAGDISRWKAAVDNLPEGVFSYSDEHQRLCAILRDLAGGTA